MSFEGKVLFATGGGSGIAAATARRFTAGGGRVAVVDLAADRAEAVAAELDGLIGLAADVADEDLGPDRRRDRAVRVGSHRLRPQRRPRGVRTHRRVADRAVEPDAGRDAGGTFLVCKYAAPVLQAGDVVVPSSTSPRRRR